MTSRAQVEGLYRNRFERKQAEAELRLGVGIVGGGHGDDHEGVDLVVARFFTGVKRFQEFLHRSLVAGQHVQGTRKVREVGELEVHIAGVTSGSAPGIGVPHGVDHGPVTPRLLYFDCGTRDQYHLHYGSRILHQRLETAGIDHFYEEFDDDHSSVDYRMDVSFPRLWKAIQE